MLVYPLAQSKKPGVTVIELLVAVGTSLIISSVLSAVFVNSWKAQISQEAYTELQQKGRNAVDEISAALKVGSGIEASITSGLDTYQTTASSIVIKTPSIDNLNNILVSDDYYIFRLNPSDNTKLERIVVADASSSRVSLQTPLTLNDVTGSLTFTYLDSTGTEIAPGVGNVANSTAVDFILINEKLAQGRTISRSLDNKVYLRNLP